MAMVDNVRSYIMECPYIQDLLRVNLNYLPEETNNCSIEELPMQDGLILQEFVDGSSLRKFDFALACMFDYSDNLGVNIDNSNFFENFTNWIEEKENNQIYPDLGEGLTATRIKILTNGFLFMVPETLDRARYQITLRLEYEKE